MFHIGQFLSCDRFNNPIMVIKKENNNYLVSVREYNGDHAYINENDLKYIDIDIYDKLYQISGYGDWWFKEYKNIYQSLIIKALS